MRPIHWLAILTAAAGWSSGGILTRFAYQEDVGAWTQVTIRVVTAALFVGAILLIRRTPLPSPRVVRFGIVQSLVNLTIPYIMFTLAYDEASAGFVGILAALIPLSTAVFAHFLLPDEPLSARKLLALFIALAGVAFLLLSGDSGLSEGGRPTLAVGLALVGVVSVGYAGVFAKKHAGEYDPVTMAGLQFAFGAVWLGTAMAFLEGAPTDVSALGWAFTVTAGLSATVLPFLLFYWLIQHVSATNFSLTGYIVPVLTLVGGIVLLDEQLQTGIIVGGALVAVGMVLSDREARRMAALVQSFDA